jgi:hypothetical protein
MGDTSLSSMEDSDLPALEPLFSVLPQKARPRTRSNPSLKPTTHFDEDDEEEEEEWLPSSSNNATSSEDDDVPHSASSRRVGSAGVDSAGVDSTDVDSAGVDSASPSGGSRWQVRLRHVVSVSQWSGGHAGTFEVAAGRTLDVMFFPGVSSLALRLPGVEPDDRTADPSVPGVRRRILLSVASVIRVLFSDIQSNSNRFVRCLTAADSVVSSPANSRHTYLTLSGLREICVARLMDRQAVRESRLKTLLLVDDTLLPALSKWECGEDDSRLRTNSDPLSVLGVVSSSVVSSSVVSSSVVSSSVVSSSLPKGGVSLWLSTLSHIADALDMIGVSDASLSDSLRSARVCSFLVAGYPLLSRGSTTPAAIRTFAGNWLAAETFSSPAVALPPSAVPAAAVLAPVVASPSVAVPIDMSAVLRAARAAQQANGACRPESRPVPPARSVLDDPVSRKRRTPPSSETSSAASPSADVPPIAVKPEVDTFSSAKRALNAQKRRRHDVPPNASAITAAETPVAMDGDGDDEPELLRMVQPSIRTLAGEVFNRDGGRLSIRASLLVPDQLGLFSDDCIRAGTIVTWYTGQLFHTTRTALRAMRSSSSTPAASNGPSPNAFFFDVPGADGRIAYYVNGFVPDRLFGGDRRCLATYLNHHQTRDNVEFEIVPDTELLVDCGERFHQGLVKAGVLRV